MNKTLLIIICAATAGVLFFERLCLSEARSAARNLAQQAQSTAASSRLAGEEAAALNAELQAELARSNDLRQRLADWDAQPEPVGGFPASLQPGQRWPSSQPWCYLPKRDLLRYDFPVFDPEGRLSEQAALLFGLSHAQRAQVEDAYAAFTAGVQATDLAYIERSSTTPTRDGLGDAEGSYDLRLPPDAAGAWLYQFETSVHAALPETQGALFLNAVEPQLSSQLLELDHSHLRLTVYNEPDAPFQGVGVIRVEFEMRGPNSLGDSKVFYHQDDEATLAFRHYAALIDGATKNLSTSRRAASD